MMVYNYSSCKWRNVPLKGCYQARFTVNKMPKSRVRSLTRSVMGLFIANKPNMTRLNHKDEYYKNYYFDKKLCHGIEIVAEYNRTSKKQAADLLMREGLSKYMGARITEQIEMEHAAHELNQKLKLTRFAMILRKYAKEQGLDISKFI